MAAAVYAMACRAGRGMCRTVPLAGALCQTHLAATGFTSKTLRVLIAGLIRRPPHTNHYAPTSDGIRIAVFYTKVCNWLLVPLTAANQAQAPPELRAALASITRHVDDYAGRAPPFPSAHGKLRARHRPYFRRLVTSRVRVVCRGGQVVRLCCSSSHGEILDFREESRRAAC
jgi:hypothetical protein